MHAYLKYRPVWSQILLFIGMAFGIFLVFSFVGTLVLSSMTGISVYDLADSSKWDYQNPQTLVFIRGMLLIQFLSLFLIPVFLFAYFSDPAPLQYLGLRTQTNPQFYLAAVLLLVVAVPLAGWLGMLNQEIPIPGGTYQWMKEMEDAASQQVEFMLGKHNISQLLVNLVFIAVFAGVGEELFFRGVLQRLFIRWYKNPWAGIVTAAFIFSAIHMQFFGFLPRMMLGILLGAIYWYSGSLWASILAHFFYDGLIVVLTYFNPAMIRDDAAVGLKGASIAVQGIISLVAVVGIIIWMKRRSTTSFEKVYANDKRPDNPFIM
ncbi:MAG: CPBP family intramembrane metalloprotease [Terrimonas sp.]|nr:CPBP family intramembrane metalloprotease [Terrimonas sp.]